MDIPKTVVEAIVKEETKSGSVIKVFCDDLKGKPKTKLLVIVSLSTCNTKFGCILINSDDYSNLSPTHIIRTQQIPALQKKYSFLTHDSYFDCSEIRQRTIEEINTILSAEPLRILGMLEPSDHQFIKSALVGNKTITDKVKKLFSLK